MTYHPPPSEDPLMQGYSEACDCWMCEYARDQRDEIVNGPRPVPETAESVANRVLWQAEQRDGRRA